MTYYTQRLDMIFQKAGVEKNFSHKQMLDKVIRDTLNAEKDGKGRGPPDAICAEVLDRLFVKKDKEFETKIVKGLIKAAVLG